MNLIKLERGSIGNNPCPICGEVHIPQNRCRFEALVKKISLLQEANKMIPSILTANKEAVTTATQFQILLRQADKANEILMQVLAKWNEVGENIKNEYLQELDKWAKEITSQSIEQQTLDIEHSTLSETSDKPSTKQTDGENSPLIL